MSHNLKKIKGSVSSPPYPLYLIFFGHQWHCWWLLLTWALDITLLPFLSFHAGAGSHE